MSYIDALYKKDEDKIYVVERDPKKGRVSRSTTQDMFFIIQMRQTQKHDWRTIAESHEVTNKESTKEQRIRSNKQLYEHDINRIQMLGGELFR